MGVGEASLAKFKDAFGSKQQGFEDSIKNLPEAIVSKEQFSKEIKKVVGDDENALEEEDIDCAFIFLCTGIPLAEWD